MADNFKNCTDEVYKLFHAFKESGFDRGEAFELTKVYVRMNDLFEKRTVTVDPEKEKLVLKVNMMLRNEELSALYFDIHEQYKTGVVVLPAFVDAAIVPWNTNVVVEYAEGRRII